MLLVYVVLQIAFVSLSALGRAKVAKFIKAHPRIARPADLEAFAKMVRWQMYAVLVAMPIFAISFFLLFPLMFALGLLFTLPMMMFNVGLFIFAQTSKKLEVRSRNLDCAEALEPRYKEIGRAWVRDLLPKF